MIELFGYFILFIQIGVTCFVFCVGVKSFLTWCGVLIEKEHPIDRFISNSNKQNGKI